ncbi:molybdopterin-dependent oxidoreductase [Pseudonocardia benzenivorans]|uniref:Molybdopterin-dependent oxidoreductase n=1 Tax=Pseudonocardia benzenivorans TaxID=228005 RepID=A0ABW3VT83_9PSEU
METKVSYCRTCGANCGMLVDVEDDKIVRVRANAENSSSAGYTCVKGRNAVAGHNSSDRILRHLRRRRDGGFDEISLETAVSEIADRLGSIMTETGPESVGIYWGTYAWMASATIPVAKAWWRAIGSHKSFSPITIDQASKTISWERTGFYTGGFQRVEDADVWLEIGGNQLISLQSVGWSNTNPFVTLKEHKKRGLKLIVIDPRRTELAKAADLHLRPRPGTDAVLLTAILNVIFDKGLDRPEFYGRYADNVEALKDYVRGTTPAMAAEFCDVPEEDIIAAAVMFGEGKVGAANGHTGTDMGPGGNPCEQLILSLNIICGRFVQEGEQVQSDAIVGDSPPRHAQVIPPSRHWDKGWRNRFGYGLMPSPFSGFGEVPCGLYADEILEPGEDRVRAMFSIGGNPVNAIPDLPRQIEAAKALDLLVNIDPYMTETSRLSDYIIAPTMMYERPDVNVIFGPFGIYTPALVPPPGDTVEEWQFFWLLGQAMGLDMELGVPNDAGFGCFGYVPPGRPVKLTGPLPSSDEVLAMVADNDALLEELKKHPNGLAAPRRSVTVQGPAPGMEDNRLDLFPPEFPQEMEALRSILQDSERRHYRLIVRRAKELFNNQGRNLPEITKGKTNPLYIHPDDLASHGLGSGDRVTVTSDHGTIAVVTKADDTLRRGVVALTHGWGGLEGDDPFAPGVGASVNALMSTRGPVQQVLHMPIMTALPVDIEPLADAPASRTDPA